ncbi:carboxypeptidase B-like [Acanthaster planci]|uniref:Carboxypeptidase B-like n=1 Tax=Acanthaster planci TaxID=133434 RepID=A0A8B7YST3_ACAPL|nr:carboxypeptidase B-like [Acanthaster planci]
MRRWNNFSDIDHYQRFAALLPREFQISFKMMKIILCFCAVVSCCVAVRYDGYQTWRVQPRDSNEIEWLNSLKDRLVDKLDFWQNSGRLDRPVDVMVPPTALSYMKEALMSRGLSYDVMIADVQALSDSQIKHDVTTSAMSFNYNVYHTYDEIQQWVFDFTTEHNSIVEQFQIATSFEGRAINAIKMGSTGLNKPAIYWQGGIHAREWISPATVMYIAKMLAEGYGSDSTVTRMLDTFDIYIVPLLNADGYVYTWTNDRLWRKTRSKFGVQVCVGTDPNRNYDYQWAGQGASSGKCQDTYHGPFAHSEPEIASTTSYLLERAQRQKFVSFIDFHAYSQLFLSPWSYSQFAALPVESADHNTASVKTVNALKSLYGTEYTYGPSARTLYAASGCSVDWGFGVLGAKYSYVIELRDTGRYGFLLPASQIEESGLETFEAMKAFGEHLLSEFA